MLSPYTKLGTMPFSISVPTSIRPAPLQTEEKKGQVNNHNKDLVRCLNFYADYSGCGHWRMMWPENMLRANQ